MGVFNAGRVLVKIIVNEKGSFDKSLFSYPAPESNRHGFPLVFDPDSYRDSA